MPLLCNTNEKVIFITQYVEVSENHDNFINYNKDIPQNVIKIEIYLNKLYKHVYCNTLTITKPMRYIAKTKENMFAFL
jgi:hypothetical protein